MASLHLAHVRAHFYPRRFVVKDAGFGLLIDYKRQHNII